MRTIKILKAFSIVAFLCLSGCIKFDDPEVVGFTENIITSPCTDDLQDNFSVITSGAFEIGSFTFNNPTCDSGSLITNATSGNFDITLGNNITTSGSYSIDIFPSDSEVGLSFNLPGEPTYTANGGSIYINYNSDGTQTLEWCNVNCQSVGSLRKTDGRIICE